MEAHQTTERQLPLSVTDPRPPTGDTPTVPPLSLNSTVGNPTQLDIVHEPTKFNVLNHSFYLEKFIISSIRQRRDLLYTFNWQDVLRTASGSLVPIRGQVPFQLSHYWFGRSFHIPRMSLVLTPIKLGNSAVTVDVVFTYNGVNSEPPERDTYNLDTFEITFTDNTQKKIDIPLYYLVPELLSYRRTPGQARVSAFAPQTRMSIFLKTQYVPQLIQPTAFDVLVHVDMDLEIMEELAPTISMAEDFSVL